ncbi:uncharacterized membrane protein HdeD (DUF308 family) [Catenuloplanes nepalensis]|uniref:Uncharacterized membrane protein HdeD (DUF308 family) n=1 Tax=Catenuloplanes nepalensis TaxID=587533 RepID=A0ABT9MPB3_9ACTN|nr:hypothetical protein [Catenuloplanes nepalensis]MDP9793256.1 uncharacterized membrane protein HdeD (DUF308 family) [Catenuloplanes nepalensis]
MAPAASLRRLYLFRFGFALVWAVLLFLTGSELSPISIALLVIYPLFDVAAAIVDLRTNGSTPTLWANVAVSTLTAAGLAVAVTSGIPAVLAVWGVWAIAAGGIQLIVGLGRRALGGQWPMIISGGQSVLVGGAFLLQTGAAEPMLTSLAGYALLGGVYFLISALRLRQS